MVCCVCTWCVHVVCLCIMCSVRLCGVCTWRSVRVRCAQGVVCEVCARVMVCLCPCLCLCRGGHRPAGPHSPAPCSSPLDTAGPIWLLRRAQQGRGRCPQQGTAWKQPPRQAHRAGDPRPPVDPSGHRPTRAAEWGPLTPWAVHVGGAAWWAKGSPSPGDHTRIHAGHDPFPFFD